MAFRHVSYCFVALAGTGPVSVASAVPPVFTPEPLGVAAVGTADLSRQTESVAPEFMAETGSDEPFPQSAVMHDAGSSSGLTSVDGDEPAPKRTKKGTEKEEPIPATTIPLTRVLVVAPGLAHQGASPSVDRVLARDRKTVLCPKLFDLDGAEIPWPKRFADVVYSILFTHRTHKASRTPAGDVSASRQTFSDLCDLMVQPPFGPEREDGSREVFLAEDGSLAGYRVREELPRLDELEATLIAAAEKEEDSRAHRVPAVREDFAALRQLVRDFAPRIALMESVQNALLDVVEGNACAKRIVNDELARETREIRVERENLRAAVIDKSVLTFFRKLAVRHAANRNRTLSVDEYEDRLPRKSLEIELRYAFLPLHAQKSSDRLPRWSAERGEFNADSSWLRREFLPRVGERYLSECERSVDGQHIESLVLRKGPAYEDEESGTLQGRYRKQIQNANVWQREEMDLSGAWLDTFACGHDAVSDLSLQVDTAFVEPAPGEYEEEVFDLHSFERRADGTPKFVLPSDAAAEEIAASAATEKDRLAGKAPAEAEKDVQFDLVRMEVAQAGENEVGLGELDADGHKKTTTTIMVYPDMFDDFLSIHSPARLRGCQVTKWRNFAARGSTFWKEGSFETLAHDFILEEEESRAFPQIKVECPAHARALNRNSIRQARAVDRILTDAWKKKIPYDVVLAGSRGMRIVTNALAGPQEWNAHMRDFSRDTLSSSSGNEKPRTSEEEADSWDPSERIPLSVVLLSSLEHAHMKGIPENSKWALKNLVVTHHEAKNHRTPTSHSFAPDCTIQWQSFADEVFFREQQGRLGITTALGTASRTPAAILKNGSHRPQSLLVYVASDGHSAKHTLHEAETYGGTLPLLLLWAAGREHLRKDLSGVASGLQNRTRTFANTHLYANMYANMLLTQQKLLQVTDGAALDQHNTSFRDLVLSPVTMATSPGTSERTIGSLANFFFGGGSFANEVGARDLKNQVWLRYVPDVGREAERQRAEEHEPVSSSCQSELRNKDLAGKAPGPLAEDEYVVYHVTTKETARAMKIISSKPSSNVRDLLALANSDPFLRASEEGTYGPALYFAHNREDALLMNSKLPVREESAAVTVLAKHNSAGSGGEAPKVCSYADLQRGRAAAGVEPHTFRYEKKVRWRRLVSESCPNGTPSDVFLRERPLSSPHLDIWDRSRIPFRWTPEVALYENAFGVKSAAGSPWSPHWQFSALVPAKVRLCPKKIPEAFREYFVQLIRAAQIEGGRIERVHFQTYEEDATAAAEAFWNPRECNFGSPESNELLWNTIRRTLFAQGNFGSVMYETSEVIGRALRDLLTLRVDQRMEQDSATGTWQRSTTGSIEDAAAVAVKAAAGHWGSPPTESVDSRCAAGGFRNLDWNLEIAGVTYASRVPTSAAKDGSGRLAVGGALLASLMLVFVRETYRELGAWAAEGGRFVASDPPDNRSSDGSADFFLSPASTQ